MTFFLKDGLLNKKFVVIQYSLCNLFLVGGSLFSCHSSYLDKYLD